MILIDLQKAFDTINYEVLLQKLKAIRFSEQSNQWFRSYICDWIFMAETENKLSDFWKVSCEVTQVSFLGPLLFLILYQWYASSSKIKFSLVCWWLMPYVHQYKDIAIIEKILKGYLCYKTVLCHKAVLDV